MCNVLRIKRWREGITESEFVFEINHGFVLILNCDEDRSQFRNKEIVTKRFLEVKKRAGGAEN
jgi:ribosome-associated protein